MNYRKGNFCNALRKSGNVYLRIFDIQQYSINRYIKKNPDFYSSNTYYYRLLCTPTQWYSKRHTQNSFHIPFLRKRGAICEPNDSISIKTNNRW